MAAGLQVFNDGNHIQIDGLTPNLVFVSKGQATDSVTVSSPSFPFALLRPTRGWGIRTEHVGGSTYRLHCNGNFQYWVFAQMSLAQRDNYGLEVYGEQGEFLYGSSAKPLRIVSMLSYYKRDLNIPGNEQPVPENGTVIADVSAALPAGEYAFMPSTFGDVWDHSYAPGSQLVLEALEARSRGFMITTQRLGEYMPQMPGANSWSVMDGEVIRYGHILVADVSGL